MKENFQSMPHWEAPGGPGTENSHCLRSCVLILDVLLFGVKTAQTQGCLPHRADSWAHRLQGELEEVKASGLERINKSKNKTLSDALS